MYPMGVPQFTFLNQVPIKCSLYGLRFFLLFVLFLSLWVRITAEPLLKKLVLPHLFNLWLLSPWKVLAKLCNPRIIIFRSYFLSHLLNYTFYSIVYVRAFTRKSINQIGNMCLLEMSSHIKLNWSLI